MTTDLATRYFRTGRRLAELLGINPVNVYSWGKYPPELRQRQIQDLSGGVLQIEKALVIEPVVEEWINE